MNQPESDVLYRIVLPYAVFGAVAVAGKIVHAAPIGRWMVGKTVDQTMKWVTSKNGTMAEVGSGA